METKFINIADIVINEDRAEGGNGNIEGLAANMKRYGQINPIKVIEDESGNGTYRLIAGRRRVAAAEMLGWDTVRADVGGTDDMADADGIALSENTSREDMHPLDEGIYFAKMLASGESAEDIGALFCRTKSQVYQRAKLNNLIPDMKAILKQEKMSVAVAAMTAELPGDVQEKVYKKISDDSGRRNCSSVSKYDISEYLSKICKTEIGKDFLAKKCEKCSKRTHYNDTTLFPELEDEKDICLDYDCYKKSWKKFITDAYRKCMKGAEAGEYTVQLDEQPCILIVRNATLPDIVKHNGSSECSGTVAIDGNNFNLLTWGGISNLTAQGTGEEDMIDFRSRGILHGGLTWNGILFEAFNFVYMKDLNERNRGDTDEDNNGKAFLDSVYASLPEKEREAKISGELKKYAWQRDAEKIERAYYEKLDELVGAAVDDSEDIGKEVYAAAAAKEYAYELQQLYPDFPEDFYEEHTAEAYEFVIEKAKTSEDVILLQKYVMKKVWKVWPVTRSVSAGNSSDRNCLPRWDSSRTYRMQINSAKTCCLKLWMKTSILKSIRRPLEKLTVKNRMKKRTESPKTILMKAVLKYPETKRMKTGKKKEKKRDAGR